MPLRGRASSSSEGRLRVGGFGFETTPIGRFIPLDLRDGVGMAFPESAPIRRTASLTPPIRDWRSQVTQVAFRNLILAVRKAVISDEWRVARKEVVAWWGDSGGFLEFEFGGEKGSD